MHPIDATHGAVELERLPREGQRFLLHVHAFGGDGYGLAHLKVQLPDGSHVRSFTWEAHGTVPGDIIEIEVWRVRRGAIVGRTLGLIQSGDVRMAVRCAHAGMRKDIQTGCGGCTLQQISYTHQLEFKQERLRTLLDDAGFKNVLVPPLLAMGEPWRYRNKLELSFGNDEDTSVRLGLHPAGLQYEVTQLQDCWLMPEPASMFAHATQRAFARNPQPVFRASRGTGLLRTLTVRCTFDRPQWMLELTTAQCEDDKKTALDAALASWVASVQDVARHAGISHLSIYHTEHVARRGQRTRIEPRLLSGPPTIEETLRVAGAAPLSFQIHPRAFFQPNPAQAQVLYATVLRMAGLSLHVRCPQLLDLYCGTGTIGLVMSAFADQVVGVELNAEAVTNARQNAERNGINNATFFQGDAAEIMESELSNRTFDIAIVDPPRAGLGPKACELLLATHAERIVVVSCNPESLARDLRLLASADRPYQVVAVQPVDMFPHTAHLETVVLLQRRATVTGEAT
jgi:23S rRNA (uracil1939-C5)-methyltransferase